MEHLTSHCCYCREGQAASGALCGNLQDGRGNLGLVHSGPYTPVGLQMHHSTHINRILYHGNLLLRLVDTHIHDGLDEGFIGTDSLRIRQDAQKVHQAEVMVSAVRRQKTDVPALMHGLPEILLEVLHRAGLLHAHQFCVVREGRHGARPHDVVYGEFIPKDDLISGIGIQYGR